MISKASALEQKYPVLKTNACSDILTPSWIFQDLELLKNTKKEILKNLVSNDVILK